MRLGVTRGSERRQYLGKHGTGGGNLAAFSEDRKFDFGRLARQATSSGHFATIIRPE